MESCEDDNHRLPSGVKDFLIRSELNKEKLMKSDEIRVWHDVDEFGRWHSDHVTEWMVYQMLNDVIRFLFEF